MKLKIETGSLLPILSAIVKHPSKVSCTLSTSPEFEKLYLAGDEVSYLFQIPFSQLEGENLISFSLPYEAITRLAKVKKKYASYFEFEVAENDQVVVRTLDKEDVEQASFFVTQEEIVDWKNFYTEDFLNDSLYLTPESITAISTLVKSQSDSNYYLITPKGFCAIGDYQVSIVSLGFEAQVFKSTPFNLSSTLLNALLKVDSGLAISSSVGDYLKSESYCVTLSEATAVDKEELFNDEKIDFIRSIFTEAGDQLGKIELDDCENIAKHLENAANVDSLFEVCQVSFNKDSSNVDVVFYKNLSIASSTNFELAKVSAYDFVLTLRLSNLISALKMAKTGAVLEFIDDSCPVRLKLGDVAETYLMQSILSRVEE